jgi:hypothetical protein
MNQLVNDVLLEEEVSHGRAETSQATMATHAFDMCLARLAGVGRLPERYVVGAKAN